VVLVEHAITLKLFVKGEDSALGVGAGVASTAAAGVELGVGGSGGIRHRRGEDGGRRVRKVLRDGVVVASAAAAGVEDPDGGGSAFGKSDDHFDD